SRAIVRSDEALMRRVLRNLLSNAVRYTTHGRIVLGCRREGNLVRIEVWDTGPGIPQSRQREIFEEFRRLNDGGESGSGLGLAIVDRIARLLGHRIGLRSWPGRGSVFSVTVPRATAVDDVQRAEPPPAPPPLLQARRIWCVDDDRQSCMAARALLERWGCEVPFAGDHHAALEAD